MNVSDRVRMGVNEGEQPQAIIQRSLKQCGFNEEHREFGPWGVAYYRRTGYKYSILRGNLAVYELERVDRIR